MRLESPNFKVLGNVSVIVFGVIIASWGEIDFHLLGFLYQVAGICFEATRLVMVQRLLSSAEFKMDPLVSLYYFAPVCAVMNFCMFLVFEAAKITVKDITVKAGVGVLVLNAMVAFGLNVSVVFLVFFSPFLFPLRPSRCATTDGFSGGLRLERPPRWSSRSVAC
jgi:hypothetical protein